jgi:PKD repeat protein
MKLFAKETITPLALNVGDQFEFVLKNKVEVSFKIGKTSFSEIERVKGRGVIYEFSCELFIDGVQIRLERFVSCQQAFYVPFVINGIRIWFNDVGKIFDHLVIRTTDTRSLPNSDIRIVLQDATLDICPEKIVNWYRSEESFLLIENCYGGDDCWLGVYKSEGCHGGLDINMQRGLDLIAPISLDHQFLAHSVVKGFNNNRWKGKRNWGNGDTWYLWSSHLINLTVDEDIPIEKGTAYAKAAGVWVGKHDHSHFEFWIDNQEKGEIYLDPWILFWQIFENMRKDSQQIVPRITSDSKAEMNKEIKFFSKDSFHIQKGDTTLWSFGDGSSSLEKDPIYSYTTSGVFEVILTIIREKIKVSTSVYMVIKGESPLEKPITLPVYCYGFENYRNPYLKSIEIRNELREVSLDLPFDISSSIFKLQKSIEGISIKEILNGKVNLEIDGTLFSNVETLIPLVSSIDSHVTFLLAIHKKQDIELKLFYDIKDNDVYMDSNAWFGHRFCDENNKTPQEYYVSNGGKINLGKIVYNLKIRKGKYQVYLNKQLTIKSGFNLNFEIHSNGVIEYHERKVINNGYLGEFIFTSDFDNQVVIKNNISGEIIYVSNLTLIPIL